MPVRVLETDLRVLDMRTRMVFRYGIAALTRLPHLLVRALVEVDGKRHWGIAADGLPPKWFTKDPKTSFVDDLRDMLEVIGSACDFARDAGAVASAYECWRQIDARQARWGETRKLP